MSAEDGDQELRERVRKLETLVATLEDRLHQLEAKGTAAVSGPAPGQAPPPPPYIGGAPTPASPERADLEAHLGTYWLSRVGIVALITGIAYLITWRFGELGMFARVGLGYLLSAGLGAFGLWQSKRYELFGRILFGGGLALAYFVTYALHFIPSVRVIDSQALALVLLAGLVVAIVVIAHRMHSETVAGIALFLGLHTGMLSDITAFTLLSTTLLAAGALFFLVQNRWVIVPLSSLVAVYTTHVNWALRTGAVAPDAPDPERLFLSLSFLSVYFVLFSVALLARPKELSVRASLTFAMLNWVGLVGLGAYEVERRSEPDLFSFFLIVALAHGASAAVARWRQATPALLHTYMSLCALTLALAMPAHYEGSALVASWLVTGAATGLVARGTASPVLRWVGVGVLFVGLGATWFIVSSPPLLYAVAFACFLIVERSAELSAPWLPAPTTLQAQGTLKALCAMGTGLALVWLVGEWMPAGLTTLGWVVAAFGMFAVGFALNERRYRLTGIGVLALALGRLLIVDLARLPIGQRVLTFILLGVMLLVISYTYTRLRDRKR
ncbi:DUF2339 domain-containing protein [Hyalangium minutum]|uniref:DUF2339 domain-containing protein n=1 Tax=Hyalangium minutum TaxID=394096 RepID=A0A085WEV6_9BACT|nr:DUF2339 domain-containing protein [Hyalangium minutum]KFE66219.1 hypothetical protein DB31_1284 [Hyalangium minutum]